MNFVILQGEKTADSTDKYERYYNLFAAALAIFKSIVHAIFRQSRSENYMCFKDHYRASAFFFGHIFTAEVLLNVQEGEKR